MMISRSFISRNGRLALRKQCRSHPANCRGLAAPATGSFQYQTGEAAGVKIASRDLTGPTTTLAVVAKAGTRYSTLPGLSDGLELYAFKSTSKRSALRITREAELLGSELFSYHSRENLVIGAKFLRGDLPYFAELLAEVITKTRYTAHEYQEEVLPLMKLSQKKLFGNTKETAVDSAHGLAFHRGLGAPLHPGSGTVLDKYMDPDIINAYSSVAYQKSNFAVVANGADHGELSKWVGEFFGEDFQAPDKDIPKFEAPASKYYGGEARTAHDKGNAMVIAFPGSPSFTAGSSYKPEIAVLAALMGGESSIKWSPGFSYLAKSTAEHPGAHLSTNHAAYSDAGLLYTTITGSADHIRSASAEVVKTLKKIAAGEASKEDLTKAVASAKFKALESGQSLDTGLELTGTGLIQGGKAYQLDEIAKGIDGVTGDQVKKIAKTLLDGKASVATAGDLFVLPYAEEIGLKI